MAKWTDPSGVQHNTDNSSYGDQGALPPAPSYQAPSAPNVSNNTPVAPVITYSHGSGGDPWTPYPEAAHTDPNWGGVTGNGGSGSGDLGGNAPQAPSINATGLTAQQQADLDAVKQQKAAEAEALAKQTATLNKLNQDKFDLQKAQADALNAYNTSMLQFQDKQLAQNAFDATVLAAYRTRQNELLSEQQAQSAAYQTGQLANTAQAQQQQATQWGAQNLLTGQAQQQQVGQWGQSNMLAGQAQNQATVYQGQQIALQQQSQLADLKRRRPFRSAAIRTA